MLKNLADHFLENANPKNFFFEIETRKKRSFLEIKKNVKSLSKKKILKKKKKISVILPNGIDYVEFFLTCQSLGILFHPIPYFTSQTEIKKILKFFEPELVITDRKDLNLLKKNFNIQNILSIKNSKSETLTMKKIKYNQPASMYNSSGTTGDPKGILYSYENIYVLAKAISENFKFTEKDNHLALLPLGHTASLNYNLLPSLYCGSSMFISKGFQFLASNFFKVLKKYNITYTQIVPTILLHVNKLNIKKVKIEKLRYIGCGSSYLPIESQKEFIKKYGIKVANLYGLSETGPSHIDNPESKHWEPGSIGVPLSVNKCKISSDGELMIKGKTVFVGYYKNKKLYKKTVKGGWFYTGDYGKFRNKKFYFIDRKKDLIIKGGINIFPSEIENIIYKAKDVSECVAFSKINQLKDEEVAVAIVKRNKNINENQLKKKLIEICIKNLSKHKIPNHFYFIKKIPKTASNKLMRRKIKDKFNQ